MRNFTHTHNTHKNTHIHIHISLSLSKYHTHTHTHTHTRTHTDTHTHTHTTHIAIHTQHAQHTTHTGGCPPAAVCKCEWAALRGTSWLIQGHSTQGSASRGKNTEGYQPIGRVCILEFSVECDGWLEAYKHTCWLILSRQESAYVPSYTIKRMVIILHEYMNKHAFITSYPCGLGKILPCFTACLLWSSFLPAHSIPAFNWKVLILMPPGRLALWPELICTTKFTRFTRKRPSVKKCDC